MLNGNQVTRMFAVLALCGAGALSGCQQEKKVLDIEAPGLDIEVRKPLNQPEKKVLDVEAPGTNIEIKKTPNGPNIDVDARGN